MMCQCRHESWIFVVTLIVHIIIEVNCQCSGSALTLTATADTFQVIESPNYPNNYDINAVCRYKIDTGNANNHVIITYLSFSLETSFDYLRIYDGPNSGSISLGSDTGFVSYKFYESSTQYMYLEFSSDYSVSWSGFKIQYLSVLDGINKLSCGTTITVDSTLINQQYALASFPGGITDRYVLCEWPISAAVGVSYTVKIVYTDFEDYSTYTCDGTTDYGLAIFEAGTEKYRICNYVPDQEVTLYLTGNGVIKFKAPTVNLPNRGFVVVINYESSAVVPVIPTVVSYASSCGTESNPTYLTASNTTMQYVASPNYPGQYGNNLDCWWVVTSSEEVLISPQMITLDTSDSVTIYDGPSSSYIELASYSGSSSPLYTNVSTGSSVAIRFQTDGSVTDTGFTIGYKEGTGSVPSCASSYQLISLNGTGIYYLNSHADYGINNYGNSLDSYWLIDKGNESAALYVSVKTFDIESSVDCVFDYVKVYQGACPVEDNRILFECGEIAGKKYTYTYGRYMMIHFHTDLSVTYAGWRIAMSLSENISAGSSEEEENKNYIPGIVVGSCFVLGFIIMCCKKSSKSRTAPQTSTVKQIAPERKTIPSHVVITARPPKIKPEYVIDTWKRQKVKERIRRAIDKNREKKDDFESILSSDNENDTTEPSSNLEKVVIHKHPVSPPPSYEQSVQKQEVLDVKEYLTIDPNYIPPAFDYIMPPQLQNR